MDHQGHKAALCRDGGGANWSQERADQPPSVLRRHVTLRGRPPANCDGPWPSAVHPCSTDSGPRVASTPHPGRHPLHLRLQSVHGHGERPSPPLLHLTHATAPSKIDIIVETSGFHETLTQVAKCTSCGRHQHHRCVSAPDHTGRPPARDYVCERCKP